MDGAAGEVTRSSTTGNKTVDDGTVFAILLALSFSHLMNDLITSLVPALYPTFKESFDLSFAQIGLITLTFQMTASLLQPVIGLYTDHRPKPYSLAIGMAMSLAGVVALSLATHFVVLLLAASLVGMGSAIFHPESSRIARMASGGRHGMAQSLFQVGGNIGSSLGPLMVAFVVIPHGQGSIAWFTLAALVAMVVLLRVGTWYSTHRTFGTARRRASHLEGMPVLTPRRVAISVAILLVLVFSKYFYLASLSNYYTFYLIDRFDMSLEAAQIHLFVFLAAVAVGTILGGPIGDRVGRKYVIWGSILGVLPFTLALPYANLMWTGVLTTIIGVVLASAFSVIVVYAQELMPGKVGMVAGLFFGVAFGVGGVGAAALGQVADHTSIEYVYQLVSYLPAIGILTMFLPNLDHRRKRA